MGVKPRHLEVLHAIMSSASLTEAALGLGTSQPAVSATLRQMEKELGLRLFHRHGRRLVPTQEAELLFPEVERLFFRLQAVRRIMKGIQHGAFDFLSIIAAPTLADTIVPAAFERLRQRRPGTRIRLETASARQVADSVARREFDLGLIYGPDPGAATSGELLGQATTACVMRANHPLARLRQLTVADLRGETVVTFPKGAPIRDKIDAVFRIAGEELTTVAEVTYASTACRIAQVSPVIAMVDALVASTRVFADLVVRPFVPAVSVDILLLSPEGRARSRVTADIAAELRASFAELTMTKPSQ